jgi:hypothetical protein
MSGLIDRYQQLPIVWNDLPGADSWNRDSRVWGCRLRSQLHWHDRYQVRRRLCSHYDAAELRRLQCGVQRERAVCGRATVVLRL